MVFPVSEGFAKVVRDITAGLPGAPVDKIVGMAGSSAGSSAGSVDGSASGSFGGSGSASYLPQECPVPVISIFNFEIANYSLVFACVLAAIIGLTGFFYIRKTHPVVGSFSYSITYLLFGIMMTCSMIVNCFQYLHPPSGIPSYLILWLDVTLTSSVALSFGFNGLVDLRLLKENCFFKILSSVGYLLLGFGWYYTLTHATSLYSSKMFDLLYVGVIAAACGIYCVAEVVFLVRSKGSGLSDLAIAGIAGVFGVATISYPNLGMYLCDTLGPVWGGMFPWFICSDIAMYALLRYYFITRQYIKNRTACYSKVATDFELQPAHSFAPVKTPPTLSV